MTYPKIRFDLGVNKALTEMVFNALQTMGYKDGAYGAAGIRKSILDGQSRGVPQSMIAWNNSDGTPYCIEYSTTEWFDTNQSGGYSNLPTVGAQPVKPKQVKLNSEYTAVVSPDKKTVTVGCQKIDAARIDELYKLIH